MPIHIRYGNGPSNTRSSNCLRPASSFKLIRLIVEAENPWPQSASFTLVAYFNQMAPYFVGEEEAFKACRPAVGFRLFSLVQFNEFKDRLLNTLDGIVDAAPEPESVKWTLMNRICH